ncbi:putative ABC transport system permease protein [Rubrivivax gelatinosus]|uniref:FtsX-like permease family protein n=2 Tax=Rubrivivax gelatinosus TaxID=28068 RepID=UPI0018CAECAC|nr:ABC transporter permease [Rubrivivax gelatinosus]MBG6079219.1 putative ABC transport system permease protein [Rubrivivax gelatinosus]
MPVPNPLPVVWADLRRNRLLAAVTVLLVALAVAVGVAVISQERALRQGSARAADDFDLIVGAPGSPTQLVLSTVYLQLQALPLLDGAVLARAASAPGVAYAAPIAFGDHWQGHPVVGTVAAFASRGGTLAPAEGRLFQHRGEAVVGAAVPAALGAALRPAHGLHDEDGEDDDEHAGHDPHHAHELNYTVVGRLPPRHNAWDRAILVPVEDVWALHGLPGGHADGDDHLGPPWAAEHLPGVPALAIKPASVAAAYTLRSQFRTPQSVALFPAEVLNELYLLLGNVRDLMALLALATQVLVVAAVLVVLLVGFLARQRQFAVLRAIGAGRGYVFAVVWIEVAALILAGALAGAALGYAGSLGLSAALAQRTGFALPATLGAAELRLVAGLVVAGLLIALLPAAQAFRRPIAAGLRG